MFVALLYTILISILSFTLFGIQTYSNCEEKNLESPLAMQSLQGAFILFSRVLLVGKRNAVTPFCFFNKRLAKSDCLRASCLAVVSYYLHYLQLWKPKTKYAMITLFENVALDY